ncbi:hypothetical protein Nepgr_023419 [Nepenthes gracilis]|uniref:Uncharacterized protein n=1 Tax=Nepenthes gracilis TaxID=150966 RepID=A0AAD3T2I2_NEPGR|nr:hypothetical protein Nepgr_023419 [Nepenthes gracilis]
MKLGNFISVLTYGDFFKYLVYKNPQTFREVKSITQAYVVTEEANKGKRLERTEQSRSFPGEKKRKFNGGDHSHRKHHRIGPPERKDYGSISLMRLTDMCSNFLMQIRGEKCLKWPKGENLTKYYDFHRSPGHFTEDYKTLQRR